MKKLLLPLFGLCFSATMMAENEPLWLRYPAISPDGSTIAFTYKGDIYTVPASGGRATQITSNPAYDTQPVWSPDGQKIVFASFRNSNADLYVVSKDGGVPKQLTTHTASEYPIAFRDGSHILYKASIQPDVNDSQFPSSVFNQVYEVSLDGGRPRLFSSLPMEDISVSQDGSRMLFHDLKGYEDPWRKHHQSSIARDIWLRTDSVQPKFEKLTTFRGEDRNPVWTADGQSFYYLSEENGSFNVYRRNLDGTGVKQITHHDTHPVRFLSSSENGLLCYGYDGEIYTVKEGGEPRKVAVSIVSDQVEKDVIRRVMSSGATDVAVSPNGKEVAFIIRGDIYVTSVEYETTKRITDTPQQERNIEFSPDGRSLLFSAERGATWGIYHTSLVNKEDKYFTYAHELKEEPLVVTDKASFQPSYSPDGKEVAFLEDRTTLKVYNLKDKTTRTVLDGKYNYSYSDGDQQYQWSPDGKWFLAKYIAVGGWNNTDIVLVKADGSGEMTNLTESGYSDESPRWVLDGKAMIWASDRAGYRSHGSWGAEQDVYIMFFDGEAYDKFRLSKEEQELLDEEEKAEEEKAEKDGDKDKKSRKKGKKDDKEKEDAVKELKFDLANRKDRVMRLTACSSFMGDAVLSDKGDKLYYSAMFEDGFDLWEHDLKEHSTKILVKDLGSAGFVADKKVENLFLIAGGGLKKVEVSDGTAEPIPFSAEFDYRPAEERAYIFYHAWRQVLDKFYDEKIHGIDWAGYKAAYEKFLPHINNNHDFKDMLSELLGELNGSHTGARYFTGVPDSQATASLGAFFDESYDADGLKIAEVIARGPLTKAGMKFKKGCVIETIDGDSIKKGMDYYPLLAGKAGKKVVLTVFDPESNQRYEEIVKPISYDTQSELLYKRWVEQRRQMVEEWSDGRIGYVHVEGMDSPSFRETYSELLGRNRGKEAVIVDTRHNGGGWLHDDLITLLSGKEYQRFVPRGQYIGSDPYNKWLKPSCVLVCEDNYSNAHGFPWVYKTLGVGKLIGAPVPGTMTAVWWESQIDPSLVFGIPQVGVQDMQGNYLENQELQPDVEVYNTPESQLQGDDLQLRKAVEVMLQEVTK